MMMRYTAICAGVFVGIFALQSTPANALSMKECSANTKRRRRPVRSTE